MRMLIILQTGFIFLQNIKWNVLGMHFNYVKTSCQNDIYLHQDNNRRNVHLQKTNSEFLQNVSFYTKVGKLSDD